MNFAYFAIVWTNSGSFSQTKKHISNFCSLLTRSKSRTIALTVWCFVSSVHQIKDELHREPLQLSRENLEKEPQIMELRNQVAELSVKRSSQLHKKSSMNLRGKRKRSSNSTPLVLFFIDFKRL